LWNDSGKIGDVTGGINLANVVAESARSREKKNRKSEKDRKAESRDKGMEHNPLSREQVVATGLSIAIFPQKCKQAVNGREARKVSA
jgi:hypothetical protein